MTMTMCYFFRNTRNCI